MSQFEPSRKRLACLLSALVALLLNAPAGADERILAYHSDITVQRDGSLMVIETIRVRAAGQNIRRGIYRDFPTQYEDRFGNQYRVRFLVLGVERDGRPEPYHTEGQSNGVRTYFGSSDTFLSPGEYEYQFHYRTSRQLGFFERFDQLYWNVTGNGWAFPIDRASARVTLPEDVDWKALDISLYTGFQGQAGQDAEYKVSSARVLEFRTTRVLSPTEGLTVSLNWPKGIVREPGSYERMAWFFQDNAGALALLLGFLLPLGWHLWTWNSLGRDPRKGVIIPRFAPPEGLSAAGCRYVLDMGLHSAAFTAAIVSLGVKGYLKIDDQEGDFVLYRKPNRNGPEVTEGELVVLRELLPEEDSWIELDNEKYREFQSARSGLENALKAEHHGRLFKLNRGFMIPAVLLSAAGLVMGVILKAGPVAWVLFAFLTVVLHALFLYLLRAPTPTGRRIMDEIEGFRMYLKTAEQDRLERMRSPRLTPDVFETFLPYAFALGVQNSWCERFAREFPQEVTSYQASWYGGQHGGINSLHHIGDSFGKGFSSAISAASTPPGSSSGGGGGGSSGGGGGGGGGGGW